MNDSSDRDRSPSRRTVLRGGTLAIALSLAGCFGRDDDEEDTTETEDDDRPTDSDSPPAPAEYETLALDFVEYANDADYDEVDDRIAEELAVELNSAVIDSAWDDLETQRGEAEEILSAQYEGLFDGFELVTVTARFPDGPQEFIVEFQEGERAVAGFFIPPMGDWTQPDYVDEAVFTEEDVELEATDSCTLEGTLSVPETDTPVPGAVIVHGNGPIDRDLMTGPNRPYKELAQGLASQGIAVLRYDKRTFACDVELAEVTIDEVVTDDAVTALETLRSHGQVADDQLFILGHSFGGTLAPRITERAEGIAGTIMLAPLARSIADALVAQQEYLLTLDGELTEEEAELLAEVEAIADQIRELDIEEGDVVNNLGGRPYYESLAEYDHLEAAAELDVPQLLVQGGRDYQVTVEDDLDRWEEALEGRDDVQSTVFDDLNHRFQAGEGDSVPSEYSEPGSPVAEELITEVIRFIEEGPDGAAE